MDRYCSLVRAYGEAVIELKGRHGDEFDSARQHVEHLRSLARAARLDWEEHERTHGCVKKPVGKAERTGRTNRGVTSQ